MSFLAACIQLRSTSDVAQNLATAEHLIRRAAAAGASLVLTPEATTFLGPHPRKIELAEAADGPTHQAFARLAAELRIHLLVGSVAEAVDPAEPPAERRRCHNTSLFYGPDGALVSTYRKLHLFDVDIPGGTTFQESATTAPGTDVVVAPTPWGGLGLSICYDLRFPELYRTLVDRGARLIAVPSAFTVATGRDHWHTLLRARAIETQAWVFAPAQQGNHDDQGLRQTYGHSLIVDPWGTVVAECPDGVGWCLAPVRLARVDEVRRAIPVREHRRL